MENSMAQFSYDDTFSKVADIIADKLGIEKNRITKESTLWLILAPIHLI